MGWIGVFHPLRSALVLGRQGVKEEERQQHKGGLCSVLEFRWVTPPTIRIPKTALLLSADLPTPPHSRHIFRDVRSARNFLVVLH